MTSRYLKFRHAKKFNQQGIAAEDAGNSQEAHRLYQKAIHICPTWAAPHFNLGLIAKRGRDWEQCLEHNIRALECSPQHEGARWNQGIAATALGKWDIARTAWKAYGIHIPDGEGPIDMNLGPVIIRLNHDEGGETVWATRIDPARAILESIPLPDSGHCRGDLILHDGEPTGYRMLGNREVTVFNALEILKPSNLSTFEAIVSVEQEKDLKALEEILESAGIETENWTRNLRGLCKACSEGRPHRHEPATPVFEPGEFSIGISAENQEQIEILLQEWAGESVRKLNHLELVVDANKFEDQQN